MIKNGVMVIVTDKHKTLFYVQQKDENYPIKKYRGFFSFFGGSIELGETPIDALKRELYEELKPNCARQIFRCANPIKKISLNYRNQNYMIQLYESVLPKSMIIQLEDHRVYEGIGKVITNEKLFDAKLIFGIEKKIIGLY